jgi:hypothetical protein
MAPVLNRVLPNQWNVYVPNAKESGNLFVDFSRNPVDFKVNQYCQLVPVHQTVGIWYQMGLDQRARILDTDGAKYMFPDGVDRPEAHDQSEYFSELGFRCRRRSYMDVMGKMMNEQAAWDERDRRSRALAQLAMTFRTQQVITKLTDSTQYASTHYWDLSQTNQFTNQTGNWAQSTSARETIKRTLNAAKQQILLDTRAAVKSKDLLLIMGPDTAAQISVTQEIVELVKQNAGGIQYLQNKGEYKKDNYGLPDRLYDTEYVIEDTVIVTSQRGLLTQTAQFVLPLGTVLLVHRPNSLEGIEGGRSFSTVSMHIYRNDDLTLETDADSWNRVERIAVTDNFDVNMTAPVTGMLIVNVC